MVIVYSISTYNINGTATIMAYKMFTTYEYLNSIYDVTVLNISSNK